MPNTPSVNQKTHPLTITNPPNDSNPHHPMYLHPIRNNQHGQMRLPPTLPRPHDLPHLILLTPAVPYPRRNENAAPPTNSACIAVLQTTRFKIARVSKALPKKVLTSIAPIPPLYPLYLPYPLHLPHPLPSLSFPLRETPHLRASSDRITEGYHLGQSVDFVA